MKQITSTLILLIIFSLFGCNKNDNNQSEIKSIDSVTTNENKPKEIEKTTDESIKSEETSEGFTKPCDEEASRFVLDNMTELTSKIDKVNRTYYISHSLWISMSDYQKEKLITAVADAHACLEKKAYKIKFIDDLTDNIIAQAHPELGIKVLD